MSQAPAFVLFGPAHLTALAIIVLAGLAVPWGVRLGAGPRAAYRIGVALSVLLVAHELTKIGVRVGLRDLPLATQLPLHLCALSVLLTAWVLARKSCGAYEVVYFWALGGTTQALLTPDLRHGFPHPAYLVFFVGHGLVILGVLYATFVYRFRPRPRSIVRSLAALAVVAVLVTPVNLWLGTNFLYLMEKPGGASLLDYLGPWPWYVLGLAGVALISSLFWYLPWLVADRWRGRRERRPGPSGSE